MRSRDVGQVDRFSVLILSALTVTSIVSETVLDTDNDPIDEPPGQYA